MNSGGSATYGGTPSGGQDMSGWAMLASGVLDAVSSHSANQAMTAQANANRNFARNAHQIEVADLMKAGLNPMLSFRGSGAQAPGGIPNIRPVTDNTGAKAAQGMMLQKQMALTDAQTALANNSAAKAAAEEKNIDTDTRLKRVNMIGTISSAGKARAEEDESRQRIVMMQETIPKIRAEIIQIGTQTRLTGKELDLRDFDIGIRELDLWEKQQMAPQLVAMIARERQKIDMSMSGAQNRQTAQESGFARFLAMLGFSQAETTDILGKAIALSGRGAK